MGPEDTEADAEGEAERVAVLERLALDVADGRVDPVALDELVAVPEPEDEDDDVDVAVAEELLELEESGGSGRERGEELHSSRWW